MSSRSRRNAVLAALAISGIAVLLNVLGFWFFGRVDLTRNSRYSLSQTSRDAVRMLDGLDVQVFISSDLPTSMVYQGRQIQIRGFDRELLDRLGEYQSWSAGGMRISVVRDDVEPKAARARLELFSWKDAEVRGGRLEFRKYALGAVFSYRNQTEVLPIVTDPDSLEFEITRILTRLAEKYEKSRAIEPYVKSGSEIHDAARACMDKVAELLRAPAGGVAAMMGLAQPGIADKLAVDVPGIARDCGSIGGSIAAAAGSAGQNATLDALVRAARLFSESADSLIAALSGKTAMNQQDVVQIVSRMESGFRVLDIEAGNLGNLSTRRKVGFLCGGRAFCPFQDESRLIEKDVGEAIAARNPDFRPFLAGVEQIQNQINIINNGLRQGMFENRGLNVVKVESGRELPGDLDALVVFGPEMPLSEQDRYRIDQFLLSGRTVIFFVNAWDVALFNIDEAGDFENGIPMAPPRLESRTGNLKSVLEPYGVRLRGDLVVGLKSFGDLAVSRPGGQSQGQNSFPYPLLPFLDVMDRTHVLVRNMPGIILPFATTVEPDPNVGQLEFARLISTSPETAYVTGGLDIVPERLVQSVATMKAGKPVSLALAVSGPFKSAFETVPEAVASGENGHLAQGEGRLLVIGSSMGLENLSSEKVFYGFSLSRLTSGMVSPASEMARYAARFQNWQMRLSQVSPVVAQNMGFVYNCLDWGVMNEALVDIRSKTDDRRPIDQVTPVAARIIELAFIIGLPMLFAGIGVVRHRMRRNRPW